MPTYEYKCTQDGSTFELWQEVGAPAPQCPTCGADTKKVFHPTRTIFKGSGFYVTDKRAESAPAKAAETPKTEAAPATAAPASSETKTEAPKASEPAAKT